MTRKDYEALAAECGKVLAGLEARFGSHDNFAAASIAWGQMMDAFCKVAHDDNPAFDPQRFFVAARAASDEAREERCPCAFCTCGSPEGRAA